MTFKYFLSNLSYSVSTELYEFGEVYYINADRIPYKELPNSKYAYLFRLYLAK